MNVIDNNKSANYFPALTGLRAIAAWMVYVHHFNPIPKNIFGGEAHNYVKEFHIGVTIFFVLSGFLIAYRYMDIEKLKFKKYMIYRIARIYPMFFILTSITFIAFLFFEHKTDVHNFQTYLYNITFLKGFYTQLKFTGIAQSWSLTVEELFYLAAPIFFIAINKNKLNLIFLPLILIITGIILVQVFKDFSFHGFFNTVEFMFRYTFFGRCSEFFIGIAIAWFYKNYQNRFNTNWATYAGVIVIFICLIELSVLKRGYGESVRPMGIIINNLVLPLLGIAFLFWGLLTEKTWIQNILSTKPFVLLGKSSYIFYLIHLGVIQLIISRYISANYLINFILLNIISIFLYKTMEDPINNYIRKRFS